MANIIIVTAPTIIRIRENLRGRASLYGISSFGNSSLVSIVSQGNSGSSRENDLNHIGSVITKSVFFLRIYSGCDVVGNLLVFNGISTGIGGTLAKSNWKSTIWLFRFSLDIGWKYISKIPGLGFFSNSLKLSSIIFSNSAVKFVMCQFISFPVMLWSLAWSILPISVDNRTDPPVVAEAASNMLNN